MSTADGAARQHQILKLYRYFRLYGVRRTLFKVLGRARRARAIARFVLLRSSSRRDIAMIGCGQFGFATIGYVVATRFGRRFVRCYDVAPHAAETFAEFYGIDRPSNSAEEAMQASEVRYVYVASNHATHTPYALSALASGKIVYVEKPVAVSEEQLRELARGVRSRSAEIYAGYNRPFSAAVATVRGYCKGVRGPLTLSCFVSGHRLPPEHWYRNPGEGTRVCGNVGHWLDLAVHMLCWVTLPDRWTITLAWSDEESRDDDVAISLGSDRGDLINIVLTARSEPFEGINETINLQWDDVIARIDDFRRLEVWKGPQHRIHRYWPKDVGHRAAILQPFGSARREWREVELSSLLMLRIARMVRDRERTAEFSFEADWARLDVR